MIRKSGASLVEIDTLQTTNLMELLGGISSVLWECLMKAQLIPAGKTSW